MQKKSMEVIVIWYGKVSATATNYLYTLTLADKAVLEIRELKKLFQHIINTNRWPERLCDYGIKHVVEQ